MLNLDIEKVKERLRDEYPTSEIFDGEAKAILELHPDLQYVIECWLNGKYVDFEYKGISLKEILDRTIIAFPDALIEMSYLLFHPEKVEFTKNNLEDLYSYDIVGEKNEVKRREYKWSTK